MWTSLGGHYSFYRTGLKSVYTAGLMESGVEWPGRADGEWAGAGNGTPEPGQGDAHSTQGPSSPD